MGLPKVFCVGILKSFGWKIDYSHLPISRCVIIAAPHTSNWDFLLMLLFAGAFGIKINWMGKSSLFRKPHGFIFRLLGGIAVERSQKNNLVASMINLFNEESQMRLVVAVEGTRAHSQFWKSGFYHIAKGANVPILPTFLDYSKKIGGFGVALHVTGDVKSDMDTLRELYATVQGKFPKQASTIRLKEETQNNQCLVYGNPN
jgi:1-acyl-sn-glycerol-3-phosphate acyltransferase